jgi:MSHA pilin protein MshD
MYSTRPSAGRGVTLVELVVFIALVGVAMAGVFAAFNTFTAASADPQVRKQALAIAESLLEEIELMPFTFCDPDDANAATATSTAGCATTVEGIGAEGGETRYNAANPFDNVSDYDGLAMSSGSGGIKDITNATVTGLGAYSATVTITQAGTAFGLADNTDALRISVQVTGPAGVNLTLEGYRARYSPNTLP